MNDKDDPGSRAYRRHWTPESLLEWKQEPKTKKDRKRAEAEDLFKPPRKPIE